VGVERRVVMPKLVVTVKYTVTGTGEVLDLLKEKLDDLYREIGEPMERVAREVGAAHYQGGARSEILDDD
jgi:hypothetical protein